MSCSLLKCENFYFQAAVNRISCSVVSVFCLNWRLEISELQENTAAEVLRPDSELLCCYMLADT